MRFLRTTIAFISVLALLACRSTSGKPSDSSTADPDQRAPASRTSNPTDTATRVAAGEPKDSILDRATRATREDARRRGVDFRAVGQEPGWLLEISEGDRIVFLPDYAQRRIVTPAPSAAIDGSGTTTYRVRTDAHTLDISIQQTRCRDAMSGASYPATVTVTLDGSVYGGCGERTR